MYYQNLLYAKDMLLILFLILSVIGTSALWLALRKYFN